MYIYFFQWNFLQSIFIWLSPFFLLIDRFPFYYELKIIVVLWLLSPATQGSSILYRKFVHPVLVQREQVYFHRWEGREEKHLD